MNEEQKVELKLIHMEEVVSKEVSWLWYPYIPYGKITVIEGDPGEGKTTLVLKLAAMLSKGLPLPCDDDRPYEPIHIIYQTAEDGIDDTIKPRLEQNGADCSMIRVIDETEKELSMTDERLEQAIVETNAKLIILDPIQAYIGATVDMHRANEIRPVLKKLGMIAEKYQCAVILIGHMNKASGSKSTYRGLGSIDIQATARSVLLVARLRDKPNIRIMAQDKSSLAPAGDAIGFEMTEDRGMTCIGPYDITIDELLMGNEGRGKKKLDVAVEFIKEFFGSASEIASNDIIEEASHRGIKRNTLLSAKKKLGIVSGKGKQEDGTAFWTWIMPEKTHFVSDEDIKAMQLVDILEERTVQDYRSKYNDIREWIRREREGKEKGNSKIDWDDVVFEVDLLKSQEINLDYILELIYEKNKNTKDKNMLIDEIRRIVRASTGNRAKESLIVAFINQTDLDEIQDKASIIDAFFQFAQKEQKREAEELIMEEKLNEEAAKRYILTSLRKEYASENGTDLNEILPKMSPLNPQYHTKKQSVFEKISTFVEKFKGVGGVI